MAQTFTRANKTIVFASGLSLEFCGYKVIKNARTSAIMAMPAPSENLQQPAAGGLEGTLLR